MDTKARLKIFLADLGHTYFNISPSTVPIGISYVKAMLQKHFKGGVEIRTFRYPDALLERIKIEKPDVAGFGIYAWNENLSIWFARAVRRMHPDAILVAGGLNIPANEGNIRERYADRYGGLFDVYIPYEGELPMVRLLERVMGALSRQNIFSDPIQGCFTYDRGRLSSGLLLPLLGDVNEIPSPYLTGATDEFLGDPMLMPVIQTMRGCPYRCSYCVSGEKVYSKIRPFSLERAKDEILYIKKHAKNRSFRITDDNLGILDRDVELAEFIGRLYSKEGYPEALKVYTDKATNDRVRRVALALKEHIPYNISLQSTTPEVLKNINRRNCSMKEMSEAFRWAKENNMVTGTEILHGFPGETYETFTRCVNDVYELRVDGVGCHEVWLLPNTELASKDSRAKHGFESHFTLGADALSIIDEELICECEEHVKSSKYMTAEEHYKLYAVDFYVTITLFYGYMRELAYHGFTYGIKPIRIFDEIIGSSDKYPILNGLFSEYAGKVKGVYFESTEGVYRHVKSIIDSKKPFPPTRFRHVLIGEFVFGDKFDKGIDEYIDAMTVLLDDKDDIKARDFSSAARDLKKLAMNMVLNPEKKEEENIYIKLNHDVLSWARGSYRDRLGRYKCAPVRLKLSVPNIAHFNDIHERGRKLRNSSEWKQSFFRHTNTPGMRRRMSYAEEA
ncbi:MAG: radical SAM protein [Candidatus Omnitrophica bacterium]|nr:radical SAM protein [Candidatus Omnitrophota bacterium]